jgi:cytochrome P450
MTVSKVSISLDPEVADRARQDIASGKARSLSAWLNDAARARVEHDDLATLLAEMLDETGGPLTDEELAAADRKLAQAQWR